MIPVAGGEPVPVEFEFKHRTQTQFLEFMKEAREKGLKDPDYVLAVAVGWELTDPFSRKSINELLQNYHGAAKAIGTKYADELMQAKLGN